MKHGILAHVNRVSVELVKFDALKPSVQRLNADRTRISSCRKVNAVQSASRVRVSFKTRTHQLRVAVKDHIGSRNSINFL